MTHPVRPSRMTTILQSLDLKEGAEMAEALKEYIAQLESERPIIVADDRQLLSPASHAPLWSNQRSVSRDDRLRGRARKNKITPNKPTFN